MFKGSHYFSKIVPMGPNISKYLDRGGVQICHDRPRTVVSRRAIFFPLISLRAH